MTEPVLPNIPAGRSTENIAGLLERASLPIGQVNWWLELFARCNAGMLDTEYGDRTIRRWGEVYLDALDKGSLIGHLDLSETLWRKLLVVTFMIDRHGPSLGDRLRDPEQIFVEFQWDIGVPRDTVIADKEELMAELARRGPDVLSQDPELLKRFNRLIGVRRAIDHLCSLAEYIRHGEVRCEAERWCALKPLLR